jgi:histone acetyltransferase MYST1
VLARTEGQAYVHYLHQDKRMDGYVPVACVRLADAALQGAVELDDELAVDAEEAAVFGDAAAGTLTEEEYDILHHKQIGARRNFDNVYFRTWEIRTWCVCPPARRAAARADAGLAGTGRRTRWRTTSATSCFRRTAATASSARA